MFKQPSQNTENPPIFTQDAALSEQLQTLYADNHSWLYAWLYKKVGCSFKAEGIAQNTFLRLFSLPSLDGVRELGTFLTTTCLTFDDW